MAPASAALPGVLAHLAATGDERRRALARLVAIPSVSSDPARAGDVRRAAGGLAATLRGAGLERVRLVPTGGAPLVLGERRRRGGPCLLVYGHYDVVPTGDPAAWRTPPFTPSIRGRFLHGRGASD